MQSRVAAKLPLPGKKAVSRSPMAADGRDHALAAGAADIAGNLSPLEIFSSFSLEICPQAEALPLARPRRKSSLLPPAELSGPTQGGARSPTRARRRSSPLPLAELAGPAQEGVCGPASPSRKGSRLPRPRPRRSRGGGGAHPGRRKRRRPPGGVESRRRKRKGGVEVE